jgi:hypothetical protein
MREDWRERDALEAAQVAGLTVGQGGLLRVIVLSGRDGSCGRLPRKAIADQLSDFT